LLGLRLAVDGISGSQTRSAVRSFQSKYGLSADGVVGPITEQAMVRAGAPLPPEDGGDIAVDPDSFAPVAVETPGGGRIRDKSDPAQNDIVYVMGVGKQYPLHHLAAKAWGAMVAAARRDGIKEPLLRLTSGYRSTEQQRYLWEQALKKYGSPEAARKWVAPPGGSPHHSGRAIDMHLGGSNSSSNVDNLRQTTAYKWLVKNAERFGFYPYSAEPWHWEYNPPATGSRPGSTAPAPTPTPAPSSQIQYRVNPRESYGSRWKTRRPPGLPVNARQTGERSSALPYVESIAQQHDLGSTFVRAVIHMCERESGGRFALPANIYNTLPKPQRGGDAYISAWGAFQFNRDAWRALPGVSQTAYPWECTAYEELSRPIARYAELFRSLKTAGASDHDCARALRLWHMAPSVYNTYVRNAQRVGFAQAWLSAPEQYRSKAEQFAAEAGL
jgi:hypothetical protein